MKRWTLLLIIGLVALCLGCGKQEEPKKPVSSGDVKQKMGDAAQTAKAYLAQQQDKYLKQAQDKLTDFDKKISWLKEQAAKQTGEMKKKLDDQVAGLQKQADSAKQKLEGMKGAGAEAWEKLKSGADEALAELEKDYKQAEPEKK